ncbi:sugar transferase [Streptococcus mitis]|uniref:Exopolysaccharide biosynthesis protein n=1 Tax=Streptococcus mitis TaxID=28037 RepID=A0A1X1JZ07_STRMT|nr:sugar transferase [Streptococcus mitis]ORO92426.1 exopolysaccharide biosynthesis protein [Streptococcus mitis]
MREVSNIRKLEILIIQLFPIYILSIVFDIHGPLPFLMVVHVISYYVSDYSKNFKYRSSAEELIQTIKYEFVYLLLAVVILPLLTPDLPYLSLYNLLWIVGGNTLFILVLNLFIRKVWKFLSHNKKYTQRILLVTTRAKVERVLKQLSTYDYGYVSAVSIVDDEHFESSNFTIVTLDNLVTYATRSVVDQVVINLPSESFLIADFVSRFETMGLPVAVNIAALDFVTNSEKAIQRFGDSSVVNFSTTFYRSSDIALKRVIDIIGSSVGLIICGLVSIFLVPLIKRDGGPAIFVQDRVGRNGRVFKFYKFRSMRVDAEEIKKELMSQNQMQGGMFKIENDPRITKIGHFIRKTSLDELPQFWNVLKGDMSLVGTRPPTLDEYMTYTPEQKRRLSFKPGITGLWQISGRSNIKNFDEVVKLDVTYLDGWTIWKDIEILLKTIKVVFVKDGAK